MVGIYIVAAVIGLGLILVNLVTGGHGHDADASVDHDHDFGADHNSDHGHAETWLPFFSIRFWTYFLGAFGLCGMLITWTRSATEPFTALISGVSGLIVGWVVFLILRSLQKMERNAAPTVEELVGLSGRTTVAISEGQEGKIRVETEDGMVDLLARSYEGQPIERNKEIVVVAIENDRALVVESAQLLEESR